MFQSVNDFALVDFKDLTILYSSTRFVETDPVPADALPIRNMYYEMLKKYHPDKVAHLGQEFQIIAERKTTEMNLAYAALTRVSDEPPRGSTPNQPNPPGEGSEDEHISAAVQIVTDMGRASTSVLQGRLAIGYGRAAKLIDLMAQCGFIAPSQGSALPFRVTQTAYDYRSRMGK